jgi:hypothetical protein
VVPRYARIVRVWVLVGLTNNAVVVCCEVHGLCMV